MLWILEITGGSPENDTLDARKAFNSKFLGSLGLKRLASTYGYKHLEDIAHFVRKGSLMASNLDLFLTNPKMLR